MSLTPRVMLATAVAFAAGACANPAATGGPSPSPEAPISASPAPPPLPDPPMAFERDGIALGEPADGQYVVHGDTVYYMRAGTADVPSLVAADLTQGKPRWSKPVATDSMSARWGPLRVITVLGQPRIVLSYLARLKGSGTQADRELLRVALLDANGTRLWTIDVDDDQMPAGPGYRFSTFMPPSIVAATEDHVVVGAEDNVIVLDARDGKMRWAATGFRPSALDGGMVVGAALGKVAGRNAADGKEVWSNTEPYDRADALGGGLVTVMSQTATRLLEAKTGTVKATLPGGHRCLHDADTLVICFKSTEHVMAVEAASGKVLWELPDKTADRIMPGVVSARKGVVYVSAGINGPVILDGRTGKDKVTSVAIAPAVVVPGYGIVLSDRGGLFAHRATA